MQEVLPGRYRHYKGGEYQVLLVARHSETEEPLVIYQAMYGEQGYWARPLSMFVEQCQVEGKKVQRFERLSD
jgi:hypothetical protein